MTHTAQAIIRELFELYMSEVARMPAEFANRAAGADEAGRARVVADYVAGMTDRFAIAEHDRLIAKT
jgi:dGTPase